MGRRPSGRSNFDEHRPWQQLLWKGSFASLGIQSRTRLEQRYLNQFIRRDGRLRLRGKEPILQSDQPILLAIKTAKSQEVVHEREDFVLLHDERMARANNSEIAHAV